MMHHLACRIKIPAFYSREETLTPHSEDKYKRAKRNAIGPRWIVVTMFLVALSVNYVHAQVKPSADEQKSTQSQAQQSSPPPTLQQKPDQTSDAEMISGVGQLHEMDRRRLRQIQAELENVDIEYKRAGKEFEQLDKTLAKMKDQIKGEENKPATTSKAKETVALEKHWQLAKDRFDLVIQQRKMLQTQIATLEGKIRLEKKALDRLAGITKPDSGISYRRRSSTPWICWRSWRITGSGISAGMAGCDFVRTSRRWWRTMSSIMTIDGTLFESGRHSGSSIMPSSSMAA
jgi:hypothetical protein